MKKLLFFIGLFFIGLQFNLYSQEIIDGIGKLKLNCSPEVFKEIGYRKEPIIINEYDDYRKMKNTSYKSSGNLYMIEYNEDMILTEAVSHPNVKVYFIPSYSPTQSIELKDVFLKFFNDSLYEIHIKEYPSKLEEAFDLKYGKSKREMKEEEKHYVNGLGNKITKIDKLFEHTWDSKDPNIGCYSIFNAYHDDHGEMRFIKFFQIYQVDKSEKIDQYKRDEQKRKEDAKREKLLKEIEAL